MMHGNSLCLREWYPQKMAAQSFQNLMSNAEQNAPVAGGLFMHLTDIQ